MKTSNKLLLGVFILFLVGSILIMVRLASMAVNQEVSMNVPEEKPLIIRPSTQRAQLDSLKQRVKRQGGELNYSHIQYNNSGMLTEIAGEVEYPCCSGKFKTDSLKHIVIVKGTKDLGIFVNNDKPVMNSVWEQDWD